jgi:hypothetical protein
MKYAIEEIGIQLIQYIVITKEMIKFFFSVALLTEGHRNFLPVPGHPIDHFVPTLLVAPVPLGLADCRKTPTCRISLTLCGFERTSILRRPITSQYPIY